MLSVNVVDAPVRYFDTDEFRAQLAEQLRAARVPLAAAGGTSAALPKWAWAQECSDCHTARTCLFCRYAADMSSLPTTRPTFDEVTKIADCCSRQRTEHQDRWQRRFVLTSASREVSLASAAATLRSLRCGAVNLVRAVCCPAFCANMCGRLMMSPTDRSRQVSKHCRLTLIRFCSQSAAWLCRSTLRIRVRFARVTTHVALCCAAASIQKA